MKWTLETIFQQLTGMEKHLDNPSPKEAVIRSFAETEYFSALKYAKAAKRTTPTIVRKAYLAPNGDGTNSLVFTEVPVRKKEENDGQMA